MSTSVQEAIRDRPMTAWQVAVVAMCVLINTIDGFDILAITYAAPAIAREWGLTPERVGFLFGSGLAGISLGVLVFAFVADRMGRRPVILLGTMLIAIGMAASAWTDSVAQLAACRFVTGLGIGSMVTTAGTLVIEYSSRRWRTFSVALVVLGFPFGGMLCGFLAVELLGSHGWRSLFLFGAGLSVLLFPVLVCCMPESIEFLADRRPRHALARINRYAARMRIEALAVLPERIAGAAAIGQGELLQAPLRRTTIFLGVAYFCFMFTFYFIQSWAVSLVTARGLADAEGVTASALMNLGGLAGGLVTGYLGTRMPLPPLLQGLMIAMAVSIIGFGLLPLVLPVIYAASLVLGFVMWGATAVVYSGIALSYPGRIRATGIGLVSTAGRMGSFLGPYVAGVLLTLGMSMPMLTLLLGLPAVLAGLMFGRTQPETPHDRNGGMHG